MKDNRLLKVLWGIVLAIFLCSALFIGISYFTGGDSSSKKKDNETTSSSSDKNKSKDKDSSKSKSKEKSDEKNIERIKNLIIEIAHLLQTHLINQKVINQVIPIKL